MPKTHPVCRSNCSHADREPKLDIQQTVVNDDVIELIIQRAVSPGPPDKGKDQFFGEDQYKDEWGIVRKTMEIALKLTPMRGSGRIME